MTNGIEVDSADEKNMSFNVNDIHEKMCNENTNAKHRQTSAVVLELHNISMQGQRQEQKADFEINSLETFLSPDINKYHSSAEATLNFPASLVTKSNSATESSYDIETVDNLTFHTPLLPCIDKKDIIEYLRNLPSLLDNVQFNSESDITENLYSISEAIRCDFEIRDLVLNAIGINYFKAFLGFHSLKITRAFVNILTAITSLDCSSSSPIVNINIFTNDVIISGLLSLFERYPSECDIHRAILEFFRNITNYNSLNCEQLGNLGLCDRLHQQLSPSYLISPITVQLISETIINMSNNNENSKMRFFDLNTCSSLCEILGSSNLNDDTNSVRYICLAISSITSSPLYVRLWSISDCQTIANILNSVHKNDQEIIRSVCSAILNISTHAENKTSLCSTNILTYLNIIRTMNENNHDIIQKSVASVIVESVGQETAKSRKSGKNKTNPGNRENEILEILSSFSGKTSPEKSLKLVTSELKLKIETLEFEKLRAEENINKLISENISLKGNLDRIDEQLEDRLQEVRTALQLSFCSSSPNDFRKYLDDENSESSTRPSMSPISSRPSFWVRDKDVKSCMICAVQFSIFIRRHHCRKCGKCICHNCGPQNNTAPILEMGYREAVRHCKECYRKPEVVWDIT